MLIRQTLLYLPAQLFGPLAQFIAAVVWTHLMGAHDYGDLMIILSAQELIFLVCMSWWTHYTMRYLGEIADRTDPKRFQAQENTVLLIASLFQCCAALVMVRFFVESTSFLIFALTSVFVVTRSALTHLAERARLRGCILDYTLAQTIGPVMGTLVGLALLSSYAGGAASALAGYGIAQVLALSIVWFRLGFGTSFARPTGSLLKVALAFGLPLLAAGAMAWVSVNGIRLIVEHFRGATEVGLLSVGWGLGQRAVSVVAMLVTAASYPLALHHMNSGAREKSFDQVSLNGAMLIALIVPTVVGVLVIGPLLVKLMIGADFRDITTIILPIAVVAAGLRNMRVHFLDQVFLLAEQPGRLMKINLFEAVVTVIAATIGLLAFGLSGAAFGCLLGTFAGAAACLWYVIQEGLRLPWIHIARIALASAIMAVVLTVVKLGDGPLSLVGQIVLGVTVYFTVLGVLYLGSLRQALGKV